MPKKKSKSGEQPANDSTGGGDDERFARIAQDPLFREMPKKRRKVVVDDRFKKMFAEDERFHSSNVKVDKRGRRLKKGAKADRFLDELYQLDEDKEEPKETGDAGDTGAESSGEESGDDREFEIKLDLARGEGNVSSSSSDEESSEESDVDEDGEIGAFGESAAWGELDRNVRQVEWASGRLAVCNLDWDRLKAEDLMTVLNSFKPEAGRICSVAIYLSDFGHERLEEETVKGPRFSAKLMKKVDSEKKTTDEISDELRSAIRAYQLERLRYYYAVCECDSEETATGIYEECDGAEYEASGVRFDLRFVPPDMEFEEARLRERITWEELNLEKYKPKRFESLALSNSNAKCSWDEGDPERRKRMAEAFKEDANLQAFDGLLAPPSDDEADEDDDQSSGDATKGRRLVDILLKPNNNDDGEVGTDSDSEASVNVSWNIEADARRGGDGLALDNDNERDYNERDDGSVSAPDDDNSGDSEDERRLREAMKKRGKKTPFQLYLERKKQIKRDRKDREAREKMRRKADGDDHSGDDSDGEPSQGRPKRAGGDVVAARGDERFGTLFTSSVFAIDKTHARYRGGGLADEQVREKAEKRAKAGGGEPATSRRVRKKADAIPVDGRHNDDGDQSSLVENLRRKARGFTQKKRRKRN